MSDKDLFDYLIAIDAKLGEWEEDDEGAFAWINDQNGDSIFLSKSTYDEEPIQMRMMDGESNVIGKLNERSIWNYHSFICGASEIIWLHQPPTYYSRIINKDAFFEFKMGYVL